MDKTELRQFIRAEKKRHSREELDALSCQICHQIQRDGLWRSAGTVLLYHSLPDEVNTISLLEVAQRDGKRVILPVVVGDDLELRVYTGETQVGPFGIQEPVGEPFTDYDEITLAIIPGMAFDRMGHRLGRGKGYYDRLLPRLNAYKIGICFPFQLLENVPSEAHDQLMNEVISRI